jgi:hypothetical protein
MHPASIFAGRRHLWFLEQKFEITFTYADYDLKQKQKNAKPAASATQNVL